MYRYDGTGSTGGTASTRDDETVEAPIDLLAPRPQANLARGVVWADILADIAADEEARHLRDAA